VHLVGFCYKNIRIFVIIFELSLIVEACTNWKRICYISGEMHNYCRYWSCHL